jgi:YD repeat-containing protein
MFVLILHSLPLRRVRRNYGYVGFSLRLSTYEVPSAEELGLGQCRRNWLLANSAPKSVVTSLAGFDGAARAAALSVIAPDGASTTTYSHAGNTVTVTDPAGKCKKFTMDAFGNLTTVVEPDVPPAFTTTPT